MLREDAGSRDTLALASASATQIMGLTAASPCPRCKNRCSSPPRTVRRLDACGSDCPPAEMYATTGRLTTMAWPMSPALSSGA